MTKPIRVGQDPLWLTRQYSAALLGIARSQFDSVIVPRLSSEHIRQTRPIEFFAPAVVKCHIDREYGGKPTKTTPPGEDGDLFGDFDSPNLERLRAAKADQAEMDVAVRMGRLIDVDRLRERLSPLFAMLRQYGERLQHTFGREAALVHNEFMDELKTAHVEFVERR